MVDFTTPLLESLNFIYLKIKIYFFQPKNAKKNDFKAFKQVEIEYIKNCSDMQFSHGGRRWKNFRILNFRFFHS